MALQMAQVRSRRRLQRVPMPQRLVPVMILDRRNKIITGTNLNGSGTLSTTIATSTNAAKIGARDDLISSIFFKGSIAEVRISNTARSAGWDTTSYNNQSSPSTFYSVGSIITLNTKSTAIRTRIATKVTKST